jgi:glycosyltransferase involved in cell wall biosynthesis
VMHSRLICVFIRPKYVSGQYLCDSFVFNRFATNFTGVLDLSLQSGISAAVLWHYCINFIKFLIEVVSQKKCILYISICRTGFGFSRDFPYLLLSKIFRVRVIAHVHGSDFVDLYSLRGYSRLVRFLLSNAELIIPSHSIAKRIDGVRKIHVLQTCLIEDSPMYLPLDLSSASDDRKFSDFTIIWNSNIITSKGIFILLDAVKYLNESGCDIRFLCCGEVIEESENERKKTRERLVEFRNYEWFEELGSVPHAVSKWLSGKGSVVCLPSFYRSEIQGLALTEAMVSGVPVVISDLEVLSESVADYPHAVVDVRDSAALATKIREMYFEFQKSQTDYFGKQFEHRDAIRNRFSPDIFFEKLLRIIEEGSSNGN